MQVVFLLLGFKALKEPHAATALVSPYARNLPRTPEITNIYMTSGVDVPIESKDWGILGAEQDVVHLGGGPHLVAELLRYCLLGLIFRAVAGCLDARGEGKQARGWRPTGCGKLDLETGLDRRSLCWHFLGPGYLGHGL